MLFLRQPDCELNWAQIPDLLIAHPLQRCYVKGAGTTKMNEVQILVLQEGHLNLKHHLCANSFIVVILV